jgi:hypothetical protein
VKGAREYKDLLETKYYDKLYVVMGSHARGSTMHIYIHDKEGGETIEVYGIVSGQPGWTEEYGWIHYGPWVKYFNKLIATLKWNKFLMEYKKSEQRKEEEKLKGERLKKVLDNLWKEDWGSM